MMPISHPIFCSGDADLQSALRDTPPGFIIALIGCSGAGKSVLRQLVLKQLYGAPCYWPDNVTPVVETMALLVNGTYFSSRHFVAHLKDQVLFPDLSWMLANGRSEADAWIELKIGEIRTAKQRLPESRWLTEAKEWENLAEACYAYKCQLISVDHATCMLVNHKDKQPADHLFNLMSWSERYGVRIMLTGIETMPKLWADKAELRRRIRKVWLPPYDDDQASIRNFARVVASMLGDYEVENPRDILKMSRELHLATGGLIGELKRLFVESVKGGRRLTRESVSSCYYSENELRDLWDGIRRFHEAQKITSREDLKNAKSKGMRRRP